MTMSIRSVACGSCLVSMSMSIICCILEGSGVADFHLLRLDWENDKELDTKMDAAIDDGDSLCCHFCPDSFVDHIAAKVLALKMDDKHLILVCELVREQENNQHMFNRKLVLTYQFLQQGHDPVVVLLLHSSYSFKL
jgi:hypothetical protein